MSTGQSPRKRESEQAAEKRVERLRQRAADRPEPIEVAADGRRPALNRPERRAATESFREPSAPLTAEEHERLEAIRRHEAAVRARRRNRVRVIGGKAES